MTQDPNTHRWSPMPLDDEWAQITVSLYTIPSADPTLLSPILSEEEWMTESERDQDVPPRPQAEPADPDAGHRTWMERQMGNLISKVDRLTMQQERR